ncbi:hypothetical protein C8R45DRAFT_921582 [Mycena sanguinolenta]|nr:hypothetical protein C8R45DRAFT_921582 [Mycena sanguinolenta]
MQPREEADPKPRREKMWMARNVTEYVRRRVLHKVAQGRIDCFCFNAGFVGKSEKVRRCLKFQKVFGKCYIGIAVPEAVFGIVIGKSRIQGSASFLLNSWGRKVYPLSLQGQLMIEKLESRSPRDDGVCLALQLTGKGSTNSTTRLHESKEFASGAMEKKRVVRSHTHAAANTLPTLRGFVRPHKSNIAADISDAQWIVHGEYGGYPFGEDRSGRDREASYLSNDKTTICVEGRGDSADGCRETVTNLVLDFIKLELGSKIPNKPGTFCGCASRDGLSILALRVAVQMFNIRMNSEMSQTSSAKGIKIILRPNPPGGHLGTLWGNISGGQLLLLHCDFGVGQGIRVTVKVASTTGVLGGAGGNRRRQT